MHGVHVLQELQELNEVIIEHELQEVHEVQEVLGLQVEHALQEVHGVNGQTWSNNSLTLNEFQHSISKLFKS